MVMLKVFWCGSLMYADNIVLVVNSGMELQTYVGGG